MQRREFLGAVAATGVLHAAAPSGLTLDSFKRARPRITLSDGSAAKDVIVQRQFDGPVCRSVLRNRGKHARAIREVVLCSLEHGLPPETQLYGESFQMLSQTAGTIAAPADLGYSEPKHYRIPQPADARSMFGLLTLSTSAGIHTVLAFTSCRRFAGRFYLRPSTLDVVIDAEGLSIGPGESWPLEDFFFAQGRDRNRMLDAVVTRITANHPSLPLGIPPAGWCSWYCFGPGVTAQNVRDNLDAIANSIPGLKYIQLDDGYQAAMGDWLDVGSAFGGDVRTVLREIKARGFEPAIWVAPFVAEAGSKVFAEHPDWFIRDTEGKPLNSEKVTFRGWRRGPWYALDGTHPGVRQHLEHVFRTMREEWGCTYFKLDANFWGAMHGGRFYDPAATRIQAYRRGMQAILRGAGDSFILGCNHPLWASFGLIHGSRSSDDISRKWDKIKHVARQNLSRNWQNGRLWWNDPDCVVLTGDLSEEEFRFHATAAYASGGLVLSGDDLTRIAPARLNMLRTMLPPPGAAARFDDARFQIGRIPLRDQTMVCLLNWDDHSATLRVPLENPSKVRELWTAEDLGLRRDALEITVPPHGGRLLALAAA